MPISRGSPPTGVERGRRLVVRNGSHRPREVLTSAGAVEVVAPRVNDRWVDPDTGQRRRFSSAVLPPWCRKTPKITEVLPLLYLHGLSCGDFVPALGEFLGSAAGLSASVITKLTETWRPNSGRSRPGICPKWTMSTCGPTASTSTSGWRSTSSACWC
jgi:Transposase, Mutator family